MKKTIARILEKLLGRKYYANIVNDMQMDFICSTPFRTRAAAESHRKSLCGNQSVHYVSTVTFRSREPLDIN